MNVQSILDFLNMLKINLNQPSRKKLKGSKFTLALMHAPHFVFLFVSKLM